MYYLLSSDAGIVVSDPSSDMVVFMCFPMLFLSFVNTSLVVGSSPSKESYHASINRSYISKKQEALGCIYLHFHTR